MQWLKLKSEGQRLSRHGGAQQSMAPSRLCGLHGEETQEAIQVTSNGRVTHRRRDLIGWLVPASFMLATLPTNSERINSERLRRG